jgi:hypothetical protein
MIVLLAGFVRLEVELAIGRSSAEMVGGIAVGGDGAIQAEEVAREDGAAGSVVTVPDARVVARPGLRRPTHRVIAVAPSAATANATASGRRDRVSIGATARGIEGSLRGALAGMSPESW